MITACTGESQSGNAPAKCSMMHAQEALRRARHGAVNHHWRVRSWPSSPMYVQAQARRLDKIDLDRRKLPFAAQHVARHEVGFGAVEGGLARGF